MRYLFLLLPFFGLASCSRAQPVINYYSLKLVYFQNSDAGTSTSYSEQLAFFVLPDDPDGPDDFDELRLYHDREGLMWRLVRGEWTELSLDGRLWIGAYGLSPPEGEKVPSGLYRAVIIDKGGERSESSFGLEAPSQPVYPFPEFKIENGVYSITTEYPYLYFITYGADGTYMSTIPVNEKSGSISGIAFPANAVSFALWADDRERSTAALTRSYPTK